MVYIWLSSLIILGDFNAQLQRSGEDAPERYKK